MTEPLWPAPPPRRGGRIRHRVLCSRQGDIATSTRRTPTGVIVVVDVCSECEADDFAERLLDQARADPPDDAA